MKVTILPPRRPNLEADEISAIEALLMLASGVGRYSSLPPSSDSTAPTTRVIASNPNNRRSSKKIHECSICHKGFSTGQALGGHMTTHRKKIKKSSHGGSRPCNAAAAPMPILTNKNIPACGQKRKHDNDDKVILIIKRSGNSNYKDYSRLSPSSASPTSGVTTTSGQTSI